MVVITVFPHPTPTGTTGPTRTFGVEEELLLVDAVTLEPAAAGVDAVRAHAAAVRSAPAAAPSHQVTTELQQEQIEVAGPPLTGLADQIAAIRRGRGLADAAARAVGARAVALAAPVAAGAPHLVPTPRFRWLRERFGLVADEQLTCGLHVHVGIGSREEGVAVLDRIRGWLPVLLALSGNSPFWYGRETGFSSHRYQAWVRWPAAGPGEVFGSVDEHDRQREALPRSGVLLDLGMIYSDARLSARYPTVEIRIADVCLDAEQAGVLAALARALVKTASRQWRAGLPAPAVSGAQLRAWSWQASRAGAEGPLVSPSSAAPAPAGDVVAELLAVVHPVLAEWGEAEQVESVAAGVLRHGSGARRQRTAFAARRDPLDVVRLALEETHR
ncbi:glutamate--cysteine ligase [Kocuria aegyptia]|uniref:Putative glutamate--cysteine ligase 2 n=1 Tax=Kocuria aegyptia TaxID=330943 RepID=A0ABN2KV68_9MICC